MADSPNITLKGLCTSPNPYSEAPNGSLEIADNVVLRDPALLEPRRGYAATTATPSPSTITRLFPAKDVLYVFHANGDARTYSSSTGWSSAFTGGPFDAPDSTNPVRTAAAAKSLFLTTSSGVKISDATSDAAISYAGIGPPPFIQATLTPAALGWLAVGASAVYAVVYGYYDANNILVQSAPSSWFTVTKIGSITYPSASIVYDGSSIVTFTASTAHGLSAGESVHVTTTDVNPVHINTGDYTVAAVASDTVFSINTGYLMVGTHTGNDTAIAANNPVHATVTAQLPATTGSRIVFAQLYRSLSNRTNPTGSVSAELYQIAEHVVTAAEVVSGTVAFAQDTTPDAGLSAVPLYTNALTGDGVTEANDMPPLARDLCLFNNRLLYVNTTERQTLEVQLIGTAGLSNGSTVNVGGIVYTAAAAEAAGSAQFRLYTSGTPTQNFTNTAQSLCRVISRYNYLNSGPLVAYFSSDTTNPVGTIFIQEAGVGGGTFTMYAGQNGQTCWSPDMSLTTYVQTSDPNRRPSRVWWSRDGEPWAVPADNWAEVGAPDKAILRAVAVRSTVFLFKEDGLYTIQGETPDQYSFRPFDQDLVLLAPETCAVVDNAVYCWTNRGHVFVSESGVSPAISQPIERDFKYIERNYTAYTTAAFGVPYTNEGLYICATPIAPGDNGCSQQYVFNTSSPSWTRWLISNAAHGCFDPTTQALAFGVGSVIWTERKSFTSLDFQNPDGTAIPCTVRLLPIAVGNPLYEKLFRTFLLSFRLAEFSTCTVGFDSDAAGSVTTVATKSGPGASGFGGFAWGGLPFGIASRQFILRVDMPQGTALAANLGMTLNISQATRFWQLQGVSVLFEASTNLPRR